MLSLTEFVERRARRARAGPRTTRNLENQQKLTIELSVLLFYPTSILKLKGAEPFSRIANSKVSSIQEDVMCLPDAIQDPSGQQN